MGTGQNVLLITVDGLNYSASRSRCLRWQVLLSKIFRSPPYELRQHYRQRHLWPVLWHSPSYMDGILSTRTPAALITALISKAISWGYSRQMALPARLSPGIVVRFLDAERTHPIRRQTATQWINWLGRYAQEDNRCSRGSLSMALTLTTAISRHLPEI